MPPDLKKLQEEFSKQNYLWTAHASNRAAARLIYSYEIEQVIENSDVIEDYPNDKYGPSCLILGTTKNGRVLHVQVSYPPNIKIITVYEPSPKEWEPDWKTRKK